MFKIRRLTSKDARNFHELRIIGLTSDPHSFASDLASERKKKLSDVKTSLKNSFVLGAFQGKDLIGATSLNPYRFSTMAHKTKVGFTFVHEDYRRFGIGRQLMEALVIAANKIGYEQIALDVVTTNKPAVKLYKSLGFSTYGKEAKGLKFGNKYLDEFLMVKFL